MDHFVIQEITAGEKSLLTLPYTVIKALVTDFDIVVEDDSAFQAKCSIAFDDREFDVWVNRSLNNYRNAKGIADILIDGNPIRCNFSIVSHAGLGEAVSMLIDNAVK